MNEPLQNLGRALAAAAAWLAAGTAGELRASPSDALAEAALLAGEARAAGTTVVPGRAGWLFFAPELRHLGVGPFWGEAAAAVSRATKPAYADPLPAILDFQEQLARAGIELILVPVPPKAVIYPEMIFGPRAAGPECGRIDIHHRDFYALLRARGVTVIDLVPEFLARKPDARLFCRQDTHWSGEATVAVAAILAAELRQRPWVAAAGRTRFEAEVRDVAISGDLGRELGAGGPDRETLPLRFVGTPRGGSLDPVAPDPASPLVLLGDSHDLVFHAGGDMHAIGAGLPDQLALELGFAVDLVAVRGSGATPARINLLRRARQPGYLAGKKAVIWCFAAREFTESSGWMKVPVVP